MIQCLGCHTNCSWNKGFEVTCQLCYLRKPEEPQEAINHTSQGTQRKHIPSLPLGCGLAQGAQCCCTVQHWLGSCAQGLCLSALSNSFTKPRSPPPEAHGPLRLHVTAQDCHNTTCYSRASLKSVSSGQGRNLSVFVASKVFTLKKIWDKNLPCEKLLNLAITMVNILLGCEF